MVYVRRTVDLELDDLFPHVAAIALDGPKAVGKTTTAAQRGARAWVWSGQRSVCPLRPILNCSYLVRVPCLLMSGRMCQRCGTSSAMQSIGILQEASSFWREVRRPGPVQPLTQAQAELAGFAAPYDS